jgi:protein-tyrosine phosphatase
MVFFSGFGGLRWRDLIGRGQFGTGTPDPDRREPLCVDIVRIFLFLREKQRGTSAAPAGRMPSLRLLPTFSLCTLLLAGCAAAGADDDTNGGGSALSDPSNGAGKTPASSAPASPAQVSVAGLPNLRDIGGKATPNGRMKTGQVYRSEALANMNMKDPNAVNAWNALHVAQIIDFRGTPEIASGGEDPSLPPAKKIPLPIFDEAHADDDLGAQLMSKIGALGMAKAGTDPSAIDAARADLDTWAGTLNQRMVSSYEDFIVQPLAAAQFKAVIERVASGTVTSFHCVSGKDRTGFAAAIILRGIGVSWTDTLADYMESNTRLDPGNKTKMAGLGQVWDDEPGHPSVTSLQTILGVDPSFITASFAKIQELYGQGAPANNGEVASDGAIANYYDAVMGPGMQDKLKATLVVRQ